jgi:ABC-2 type transport system ATP-binding protein
VRDAIAVDDLSWKAGTAFALQGLTMRVPRGSIYGFLGPNGSGKTTTIRMLMGMMKPDGGHIRVLDGSVPGDLPTVLARVGYVPERPHVYPALTVAEALRYHGSFFPGWDAAWAKVLATTMELDPDQRVRRLSKGQTGKLLIVLALAQRPDLLILDEPTDGLDPVVRRDILTSVLDYVAETGATVLISSHLVHELERICDWVGVLDDGRLVAELPMQSFKDGMKRLRVAGAPRDLPGTPFVLLTRAAELGHGGAETWIVRGWTDAMRPFLEELGATVKDVADLDLEEAFVELLRSSRTRPHAGS